MPGLVAVLSGGRAIYVEQFRGPDRALGRAFPAHATALGKALLAEAPEAVLEELVLDPWTERTIADPKALAKDLAATRKRGWAIEDGELDLARRSIGSVVRDHRGTAVAAIGVGGIARELPDTRLKEVGRLVVAEARRVSQALGGGSLAELGPPQLEVEVLAAVEPPVSPERAAGRTPSAEVAPP
jgi:DNA-binding IclR family transcriptional regulator